jgi:YidC/Oxa1 family membrane protein insertase
MIWAQFVDLVYGGLVCVSAALGGSMGWAIAVVSLVVRVALLPLTLRMACHGLETRAALRRLEPELQRVRAKHKKDQRRALEETARLYRKHGVKLADERSLFSAIVQLPIFMGLFGAIRRGLVDGGCFLWVNNIAVPDVPLAVICAVVTALSASLAPGLTASQRAPMVLLPALLTLFFLSRLAAGLSIYALAQGLVGLGQAVLVRRRARQLLSG